MANMRLDDLEALALVLGPRVEPDVDPVLHVAERPPRAVRARRRTAPTPMTRKLARSVATHSITTNRAKNSSDEPRSFWPIITTTANAHASRTGTEVLGVGQAERTDLPRACGEQLAPLDEVGGEEEGERDLGELAGLEADRPDAAPRCARRRTLRRRRARAAASAGRRRASEEASTCSGRGRGPAARRAACRRRRAIADERPRRLQAGEVGRRGGR